MGGIWLLVFYFGLLSIANSPSHAGQEFARLWYWVIALAAGFGLQIGLYAYAKERMSHVHAAGVAASGGISGASMAACCAHHLTDVLPLIGLTALSTFLGQYQIVFMIAGVISNLIGVLIMLRMIKKHGLYEKNGIIASIVQHEIPMYTTFYAAIIILGIVALRNMNIG